MTSLVSQAQQAAANNALCKVGNLYLMKCDEYVTLELSDFRRRYNNEQSMERIKKLDPAHLISLGFEIAEKWAKDDVRDQMLMIGDGSGRIFNDKYTFTMVANGLSMGADDKEICDKAPGVISEKSFEEAETTDELPLAYNSHNVGWKFEFIRNGQLKQYRCVATLID